MKKNWVYYMQKGLQSMWKKKEVPDYRTVTQEIKFNKFEFENIFDGPI